MPKIKLKLASTPSKSQVFVNEVLLPNILKAELVLDADNKHPILKLELAITPETLDIEVVPDSPISRIVKIPNLADTIVKQTQNLLRELDTQKEE